MSEPVSPADTIRHDYVALRSGVSDPADYFQDDEGHYHAQDCQGCKIAELLAVGERDKAALADAAVVLEVLAGQIRVKPYRELTADFQAKIAGACDSVRAALLADGAPLTSERERDGRQIARLTEALEELRDEADEPWVREVARDALKAIGVDPAAVLAGEEDANGD